MNLLEVCAEYEKYAVGYTHPLQIRWEALVKELKSLTDLAEGTRDPDRLSACMHKIHHLSDEGIKLIKEVIRIKYAVFDETPHWGGTEGYFKQRAKEILSMLQGKMLEENKLPLLENALKHAFELGQTKDI